MYLWLAHSATAVLDNRHATAEARVLERPAAASDRLAVYAAADIHVHAKKRVAGGASCGRLASAAEVVMIRTFSFCLYRRRPVEPARKPQALAKCGVYARSTGEIAWLPRLKSGYFGVEGRS